MDGSLAAFALIALVLTVTPGADMALVTRNTVSRGRLAALCTTLGICVACSIHAVASSVGLSALLATSALAFSIVKFVGAGYLIWLGFCTLRDARRAAQTPAGTLGGGGHAPGIRRLRQSAAEGLLTNLLNPKVALFYLMVLPQFTLAGAPVLPRSLMLASIHIGFGLIWLTLYATFIHHLRRVLTAPNVKCWVERVTGAVLLGLGLRLAIERRP